MPSTVAYVRVSSRAQDHASQRAAVERAAGARGETVARWYSEKQSARTLARPALDQLRADARAGLVGTVWLYRLDRLSRSGIRDTFEVVEELRAHGVRVATVADGFDLDGPAAEVVLAVMAWAAKMERIAINERISAARERLAAEGRRWGRPPRMAPPEVRRARALAAGGMSQREVARAMGVPRSTVVRALARKVPPPPASRSADRA